MNTSKISVRYANALYSIAKEEGKEDSIYEEMYALSGILIKSPDVIQALSNPIYSNKDKESLLTTALGKNGSELMKQFIHFIVAKGRQNYILFMAMMFQEIYRKDKNIILSKVTTAREIDKETLENLRKAVEQKTGKKVLIHDEVNANIIGGYILEMNNERYDGSVKTSLETIEKELLGKNN